MERAFLTGRFELTIEKEGRFEYENYLTKYNIHISPENFFTFN
jgi:hypothetical protein